jgi:hypothetical protein
MTVEVRWISRRGEMLMQRSSMPLGPLNVTIAEDSQFFPEAGQSLEVYKTVRVSAAPTRTAQVSKSAKASNTSKRPRATGTAKEKPVVTKVAQQTRGDTPTKRKR